MSRSVNARGHHYVDVTAPRQCTGCLQCARVCPDVAIEIHRLEARTPVPSGADTKGI
jgi:formate hydrogenlyase subunit 6/NADH:ubiquinone oxidoreductase subunit I